MIKHIKSVIPETFVIAGNVGTPEAVRTEMLELMRLKLVLDQGKSVQQKLKTGFGTGGWQLAALKWCSKAARKPLIADGGIRIMEISRNQLDLVLDVMIGSLFAGHEESPGQTIELMEKHIKSTMVLHQNFKKVNVKTLGKQF